MYPFSDYIFNFKSYNLVSVDIHTPMKPSPTISVTLESPLALLCNPSLLFLPDLHFPHS